MADVSLETKSDIECKIAQIIHECVIKDCISIIMDYAHREIPECQIGWGGLVGEALKKYWFSGHEHGWCCGW
jgi:hypothetical protein